MNTGDLVNGNVVGMVVGFVGLLTRTANHLSQWLHVYGFSPVCIHNPLKLCVLFAKSNVYISYSKITINWTYCSNILCGFGSHQCMH